MVQVHLNTGWMTQMDAVQHEMELFLDHFAGSKPPKIHFARRTWQPPIDIYETDDEIVIVAELAGMSEDEVEIIVDRGSFSIRGEKRSLNSGAKRVYYQMEMARGYFERIIALPSLIDVEATKASYSNGLIEVKLQKIKTAQSHRITVEREG